MTNNNIPMQPARQVDKLVAVVVAVFVVSAVIIVWQQHTVMSWLPLLEVIVGLGFMCAATVTDIRSQRIPNKLVTLMLGAWAVFQVASIALYQSGLVFQKILTSFAGGLFGLFIFGVVYIATKRQLGGGDVKLATVMGLFLTGQRVIGAVFYGVVLCAIYSFAMLALKRLGKKDTVPLAPFLMVGYAISMFIVF